MTFRTTLQDIIVQVEYSPLGEIKSVFLGNIDIMRLLPPATILDLEEEASQHLQEEVQDPAVAIRGYDL